MVSKLFVSDSLADRLDEIEKTLKGLNLKKAHPDVLYFSDGNKLGIEEARKIKQFLSLKPFQSRVNLVVLESSHNLSTEAQNALLKILEEPGENSMLILGAEKEEQLLPTILSRCQITRGGRGKGEGEREEKYTQDIKNLLGATIEARLEYIEKLSDKEGFLKALMIFFQKQLISHPVKSRSGGGILEFAKELLKAEEWAEANVSLRGILEYLMLKMPIL